MNDVVGYSRSKQGKFQPENGQGSTSVIKLENSPEVEQIPPFGQEI